MCLYQMLVFWVFQYITLSAIIHLRSVFIRKLTLSIVNQALAYSDLEVNVIRKSATVASLHLPAYWSKLPLYFITFDAE